jgi:hypothetical protein
MKKQAGIVRRHGEPDLVEIQLSVSVRKPKGYKISRKLLDSAAAQWKETGIMPKGFRIRFIRWRNPEREEEEDRKWRYAFSSADQADAHRTLHLRRLLRPVQLRLGKVGASR